MVVTHRSRRLRGGVLALSLCLLVPAWLAPGPLRADDRAEVLRMRAERLATEGRCQEARDMMSRVGVGSERAALVSLRVGQCWISAARFAEALPALDEAKARAPGLTDVDLYLAIARYHTGDTAGASKALEAAKGNTSQDELGQLELYHGLLLLQQARSREAALAFERARRMSPDAVEPVASYYAALAWQQTEERRRAEESLRRVIERDPASKWATRARSALTGARPQQRWWARGFAGLEYDTNVVLRGQGVALPNEISDAKDGRGIWGLEAGLELFRTESWSGGLLAGYTASAHFDITELDTQYPSAAAWLDRRLGDRTTARLRYDFGYGWVEYDPYVETHRGTLSFLRDWRDAGSSELSATVYGNDFKFRRFEIPGGVGAGLPCPAPTMLNPVCGPPGLSEDAARDRDGIGAGAGLDHRYPLGFAEASLFGGYRFFYYDSKGFEWDHTGHEFRLGFDVELPLEIVFTGTGSYTYQPFDNPSSFPDPPVLVGFQYPLAASERIDKIWRGSARFERALGENVKLVLRYRYENHDSNRKVYDYRRHVVGALVEVLIP